MRNHSCYLGVLLYMENIWRVSDIGSLQLLEGQRRTMKHAWCNCQFASRWHPGNLVILIQPSSCTDASYGLILEITFHETLRISTYLNCTSKMGTVLRIALYTFLSCSSSWVRYSSLSVWTTSSVISRTSAAHRYCSMLFPSKRISCFTCQHTSYHWNVNH